MSLTRSIGLTVFGALFVASMAVAGTGVDAQIYGTSDTANTSHTVSGAVVTPAQSSGAVLGASTTNPNLPNTGEGGDTPITAALLTLSGMAAIGGGLLLRHRLLVP